MVEYLNKGKLSFLKYFGSVKTIQTGVFHRYLIAKPTHSYQGVIKRKSYSYKSATLSQVSLHVH